MRVTLLALFILLTACGTRVGAWCLSSGDCAAPMVCMLDLNDDYQSCQYPCGDGYGACPVDRHCSCPDSPLGKRCVPIGDTSRGPTPDDGGTWTGYCQAPF
ncbi:MAG: hypothetical protein SFW67_30690 [Myxococcaceae bacterium]|nr:hypothetical protein [Myxococcaceae bacterium]